MISFAKIGLLLRRTFWMHRWEYRNPYNRTCSICDRHEVMHYHSWNPNARWWETFDKGNEAKHYHSAKGSP